MSQIFREFVQKIGSGRHTSKDLTRAEAQEALGMILNQTATPAQIGAFLIAHRIKRPTGDELAGFLDAYDQWGPCLSALEANQPVCVLNLPYDGRSRTAPILPMTALIVATAGMSVLMHGGERMPTKYGVPLIDLWQGLGVDWTVLSLEQVHQALQQVQMGFLYLPKHFPLAHQVVDYRAQLGKRPPLATTELMWSPYQGPVHVISGFVHPPTETTMRAAFALRGTERYTTVKGLEGSCDLPRDRKAILGIHAPQQSPAWQRLILSANDYDLGGPEIPYHSTPQTLEQMQQILQGQPNELWPAVLWNGGFYLWHLGLSPSLAAGIQQAQTLLASGQVVATLQRLQQQVASQG